MPEGPPPRHHPKADLPHRYRHQARPGRDARQRSRLCQTRQQLGPSPGRPPLSRYSLRQSPRTAARTAHTPMRAKAVIGGASAVQRMCRCYWHVTGRVRSRLCARVRYPETCSARAKSLHWARPTLGVQAGGFSRLWSTSVCGLVQSPASYRVAVLASSLSQFGWSGLCSESRPEAEASGDMAHSRCRPQPASLSCSGVLRSAEASSSLARAAWKKAR